MIVNRVDDKVLNSSHNLLDEMYKILSLKIIAHFIGI
jgi:hypothetical protein